MFISTTLLYAVFVVIGLFMPLTLLAPDRYQRMLHGTTVGNTFFVGLTLGLPLLWVVCYTAEALYGPILG